MNPVAVDEVIMGCVLRGLGQNVARQAALQAGLPDTVPNNQQGLWVRTKKRNHGGRSNQGGRCGNCGCRRHGKYECSSLFTWRCALGHARGDGQCVDLMIRDGLWCAFGNYHMGITAENIASRFGISREEQDRFALSSQEKALRRSGRPL